MTIAVPEPSSFAASPQPWPSMWPPTMYISSGRVVPTFVQKTSSRILFTVSVGSAFSARRRASGWRSESLFTPVRRTNAAQAAPALDPDAIPDGRTERRRAPRPCHAPIAPAARRIARAATAPPLCRRLRHHRLGAGRGHSYRMRSVFVQP